MDIKKLINRKNSKPWVSANEISNAKMYREAFVKKYGGEFKKTSGIWLWSEKSTVEEKQPSKLWLITRNDGLSFMVGNFMEFCRNNDLSKSAMYELMNGKRKSHKGFIKVEKLI